MISTDSQNVIKCPNCHNEFNLDEARFLEVEARLREELKVSITRDFENKIKQDQEAKILELKKEFENKQSETDAKWQAKLAQKEEHEKMLLEKEKDLLLKSEALQEKSREMELEVLRRLNTEREKINTKLEEEYAQKQKLIDYEKDRQIESLKQLLSDANRKAQVSSQQAQGETLELQIEAKLKEMFPHDLITEIAKGKIGADIMHYIMGDSENNRGIIIYECKRTKSFSKEWISKLKEDQRNSKADVAVIVTETLPLDQTRIFDIRDGVWVTTFSGFESLVITLRLKLLEISKLKASGVNASEKLTFLHTYLTSNEFRNKIEAIAEDFKAIKTDLDKERLMMEKFWSKREIHLKKALANTVSFYSNVQGILGEEAIDLKLFTETEQLMLES